MRTLYTKKFHTMPPQGCTFTNDEKDLLSVSVDYRISRLEPSSSTTQNMVIGAILVLLISFLIQKFLLV